MSNTKFQLANTVTDPSNYERFTAQFALTTGVSCQLVAETAGTGTDNINIVLTPAGTGAIIAGPPPDGGIAGGNARGSRAVDLQMTRSAANQVASGTTSAIIGGSENRCSGESSCCVGGRGNVTSNIYAACIGGESSVASGTASCCVGSFCASSAIYSFSSGLYAESTKFAQFSRASGRFSVTGDAQISILIARRQTTNDTAGVELFLDGGGVTYRCTIASDTSWHYVVGVIARNVNAAEDAAWEFKGVIRNNAGTTTLTQFSKDVIHKSVAAWECDVVANDANDALKVQVTGVAATTINWVARIELVEVIA